MWPGVEKPVDQFRVAAFAKPWSGVSVFASPETSGFESRATLGSRAVMGELVNEVGAGLSGRLAKNQALEVDLYHGELTTEPRRKRSMAPIPPCWRRQRVVGNCSNFSMRRRYRPIAGG